MKMQPTPKKEHLYPYSRKRIIVNSVVAVVSVIFAVFLLASDIVLLASYFLTAAMLTVLIFFIKENLARRISNSERQDESQKETRGLSVRTLVITFIVFLLLLTLPLISAGLVEIGLISAAAWFIMIVGVTTGIGASEVLIYVRSRTK
jgi:hypothetical protein